MAPSRPIVVHAGALAPDVAGVDALARLALAARRDGRGLRVQGASRELRALAAFCGLDGALGLEPGRESEQREQALGLQEERELADPTA